MFTPLMWYVILACATLLALIAAGRLHTRRQTMAIPAAQLLPPRQAIAHGITVKLRPAPGAPNTDPPTDRHHTPRGNAVITRRVGRRRSTTSG